MEQAVTFKDPEGHAVSGMLALPTSHTPNMAVFCHGFLSSKNSTTNKTMSRVLLDQGIATFRFDFFGHGDSEGPFEDITVTLAVKQVISALDFVADKGFIRVGLMGSSFGGLVALLAAARWSHPSISSPSDDTRDKNSLACLALKCPVVDFPEELDLDLGEKGLLEWKRTNTIPDLTGGPSRIKLSFDFYEDCKNNIGYAAASSITAPTMIVQGERDELVPVHQSRRFYDALQAKKSLHLLPNADHQFTKGEDFREMTTLLGGWLTTHLSDQSP